MNVKKLSQALTLVALLITLSGCAFHKRHHGHHGHHHSRIHLHGHVHGKPSHVVGALIAGAVIGHAIESAAHRAHHKQHEDDPYSDAPVRPTTTENVAKTNSPTNSNIGSSFYMTTPNGECLLVEKYPDGKVW